MLNPSFMIVDTYPEQTYEKRNWPKCIDNLILP